jgi:GH15 family glucan-1,4-alpha-glucosidase
VEQVLDVLRAGLAATAAGDCGAINVWRDLSGSLRGEAMRRMITVDSQMFADLQEVASWTRKWLEKIEVDASAAEGGTA